MKQLFIMSLLGALMLTFSMCRSSKVNEDLSAAVKLAESEEYIDVDFHRLSDELSAADTKASASLKADRDKAYAALYRFYSHVQLIDSNYVCSLKAPEEINVSASVYETLKGDLDDMNRQIDELRHSGEKVSLPVIDEDYLKKLLR